MAYIPKDPVMLLSYMNTQLRDYYPSLSEFCKAFDVDEEEIKIRISSIGYSYDKEKNRFL